MAATAPQVPTVSVVMPVYNGEDFVSEAVESTLRQTFTDFELLIVDDGSTDSTPRILSSFKDARVRIITNAHNRGIVESLNRALPLARGEFVARIDHDDVALPERLEKQIAFLRANPDYVAVGCRYISRMEGRQDQIEHQPVEDTAIRWTLLFWAGLVHSGLVVRRSALQVVGGYDASFLYAEDYDLECRLARVGKLYNIPEVLMLVRRLPQGITGAYSVEGQQRQSRLSRREMGLLLGQGPVEPRLLTHADAVLRLGQLARAREAREAVTFSLRLARRFKELHHCPGFMSSQLEWILKEHVKFAALCLARGRLAEAIMRGWMALEFAGSGLIRQPVRLLLDAALSRALNRRTPQVIANKHAPMQRQDAPAIHPAVPTDPPLSGPEPLLSVVICTYNRPSLLKTALESLEQQTARRDEFEVLVVDNDPSEQTRSAVKPFRDILQLRYVAERKTGLNHARNAGYRAARAGYVAYLDDDARAARDWVENICNIIREGNPPAIFGGPYFPFYVSEKPRWFLDCYDSNDLGDAPKQLYSSPLVTGSNIVLRKTLLQRLGGFRAEYGMSGARIRYGDETELQMRALREVTGVEVWYFPQIVVYHLVPPQKMNLRWFMSSHWAKAEASAAIDDEGGLQQYGLPALLRHLCANLALMAWGLARTLVRDRRRYPYCQNYAIEQLRPALGGISIAVTRLRRAFRGGRAAR